MITSGQFVAYFADYCFTFVPGTWRWMLSVAAAPALVQAAGLLGLPESPKCGVRGRAPGLEHMEYAGHVHSEGRNCSRMLRKGYSVLQACRGYRITFECTRGRSSCGIRVQCMSTAAKISFVVFLLKDSR